MGIAHAEVIGHFAEDDRCVCGTTATGSASSQDKPAEDTCPKQDRETGGQGNNPVNTDICRTPLRGE